ncbi:amidase domain-containing protein [Streptomyces sp. H27-C3]|uniref:amidase domain-containing protein n=1 Tax=Streptomyces sp. H27-C3 TaxID=3046305 RepID=UPI0024BBAFA7|nr:amidase domain-containing protein [Streptomyces sp. H27-C3]MDJ0466422.1 amidase domain-containing protein [Streptomyces sp. H27-C3]
MKRSTFRATVGSVLAVAAAAVVLPATAGASWHEPAAPTASGTVDRATRESFGRLTDAVLTDRTTALLDNRQTRRSTPPAERQVHLSPGLFRSEGGAQSSLRDRKERLRDLGEAYSAADTKVTVNNTKVRDAKATVRVTETTTLTYKKIRGNEPGTTGFQAHHELTFAQAAGGTWALTGIRSTDTGLSAVNAPLKAPMVKATAADDLPAATRATTTRPSRVPAAKPTTNPNGYNYAAMATYAEKYWSNYNPAYPSYDGAGAGGDCTNFVSQALKAGGWKHAPGSWDDYRKWWSDPTLGNTLSWVGVNEWSWFALSSKRTTNLSNVWEMGVGDVLQVDFDRNGSKDHTMLVSYRNRSGTPYVTYHSNNTYRKSIASLVASYPTANYYAYRT